MGHQLSKINQKNREERRKTIEGTVATFAGASG